MKTLPLVFLLAASLSLTIAAPAQSTADVQSARTREVKGQVLISTYLPAIRLRFEKRFKYIGSQKFVLYDRAQAEQHFFVDADNQQRIRRMYMVQFEGYLPNINATYDYPATNTIEIKGERYIVNAESVPNVSAALSQNPESDAARAVAFLKSKGYYLSESITFQRFVRLVDEAKRNELILLYVEDSGAGRSSAATRTSSETDKAMQEFRRRALKGFTVLK